VIGIVILRIILGMLKVVIQKELNGLMIIYAKNPEFLSQAKGEGITYIKGVVYIFCPITKQAEQLVNDIVIDPAKKVHKYVEEKSKPILDPAKKTQKYLEDKTGIKLPRFTCC